MGEETGSTTTASATTQSLTTRDFPRVSGIVQFIGLILIPVPTQNFEAKEILEFLRHLEF